MENSRETLSVMKLNLNDMSSLYFFRMHVCAHDLIWTTKESSASLFMLLLDALFLGTKSLYLSRKLPFWAGGHYS